MKPNEQLDILQRLGKCIEDVKTWSAVNKLQLNELKTEMLHVSSHNLKTPVINHVSSLNPEVFHAQRVSVTL